jgi:hypothetical protein
MSTEIRKTKKEDLVQIAGLYQDRKRLEELEWLYINPENLKDYNSYVAVNENKQIVGAIGYAINQYVYKNSKLKGVVPFSWIVANEYRGIIGMQLLLKVYKSGDFGFTLEGSEMAKNIYKAAKLKHALDARILVKIINPVRYFQTSNKTIIKNILKTMYYLRGIIKLKTLPTDSSIEIIGYDNESVKDNDYTDAFMMEENEIRIKWLLSCPLVDSYCFLIKKDIRCLGYIILYIKKEISRGKIVHISHLGNSSILWDTAISFIINFFKSKNCCSVSVLAHNREFMSALIRSGFIKYIKKYNVFIRDISNKMDSGMLDTWHLTFYESDRGYINFRY